MSKTLSIAYAAADEAAARQIVAGLQATDAYTVADAVQPGHTDTLLIRVQSPAANEDARVEAMTIEALEQGQHIVALLLRDSNLPRVIDNLVPLDFREKQNIKALREQVDYLLSADAPRPLVALTPAVRKRNRRAGAVVVALILTSFIASLWGINAGLIGFPEEEYEAVETQRVEQRNTIIAPTLEAVLPGGAQEAEAFPATVEALPTRLQPYAVGTATAVAGEE